MSKNSPPKLLLRFFRWYCHHDYLEDIEGDLLERFEIKAKQKSANSAKWRFTKDVILLFRPGITRSLITTHKLNQYDMFKNYTKVGFRNILKYKMFSFINVFGLAVAMSISLLIILMLADQYQYDQFHSNKDRIYRVLTAHSDGNTTSATSPFSTLEALSTDYPIVKNSTSLRRGVGGDAVHMNNFSEMIGYFADHNFFEIFDYELSDGNPATALINPNSMVISQEVSNKLFGTDNPIGKTIDFTNRGLDFYEEESGSPVFWGIYKVTGVLPIQYYKSHLNFDVLVSSSSLKSLYAEEKIRDLSENWSNYYQTYNYILLSEDASNANLEKALLDFSNSKFENLENMKTSYLTPQALLDFRPGPLLNNAPSISLPLFIYYIFAFLATLVLILACLNYTNLSIARALTRSKEIGIRKVTGAHRKELIFQFLSESVITALLALLLANVILYFVKAAFMGLWVNKFLNFDLSTNLYVYLIFFVFTVVLGLAAGIFPALRLSKNSPVSAIKGLATQGKSKLSMRKVLTVTQFVTSLIFIITSIVIYNQFKHFMQYDYGFQAKNVLNINLQSNDYEKVKNTFASILGVNLISGCDYLPSTGRTENILFKKEGNDETSSIIAISANDEFIDVLDFKVIAGTTLEQKLKDDGLTMIINRTAARSFGFDNPNEIIGQSFETSQGKFMKVVSVIEDFTFHLLFSGSKNSSVLIRNIPKKFALASVSINEHNRTQTIAAMEIAWESIDPVHPFTYEFYDDLLTSYSQGILDIVNIVGFIAFLAITIATLGLLGIVIYTAERRTKEVGIRKTLGAESANITYLLSKDFLKLLGISILIASPIAYAFNNFWLDFMTTRIAFGFGTVLIGSLVLLVIGTIAIGSQTLKAAFANPVDSLKSE